MAGETARKLELFGGERNLRPGWLSEFPRLPPFKPRELILQTAIGNQLPGVNLVEPVLKRRYQRYLWLQANPTDAAARRRSRTDPTAEGRDHPASVAVWPASPVCVDHQGTATVTFRDPVRQAAYLASQAGRSSTGARPPPRVQQGGQQSLPGDRDARIRQGMRSPVDEGRRGSNRGNANPAPQQVRRRQESRLGNQLFPPSDGNYRNPPLGPRGYQQRPNEPDELYGALLDGPPYESPMS